VPDQSSGSYESDDFEDVSASGSASKSKITYWPGKSAFEKKSTPQSAPQKDTKDEYDVNAMEEYVKKQKQASASSSNYTQKKQPSPSRDQNSESSDKYEDEEFESMSRS
jgi:hypothetical protein